MTLDVDALQRLEGEGEAALGECNVTCTMTCTVTCGSTVQDPK